jgi:hypothetical protein
MSGLWFKLAFVLLWLSDVFIAAARWCSSRATTCIAKGRDATGIVERPEAPVSAPVAPVGPVVAPATVLRAPRTVRERRFLREITDLAAGNGTDGKPRKTQ